MATKKKSTKKKAPTKTVTSKKKRVPKETMRTFAIRVTDEELEAIHRASGPRNATRFVRAVAAAFANGDEAAFRAVLKDAGAARSTTT